MNANAPITEGIDERILKLLGLEETFDIDYGTYLQSLREKLIRVTSYGEKISDEDFTLLKNELKRIKPKEKSKSFKIKPERIFDKKKSPKPAKISVDKLLPAAPGSLVKRRDIEEKSKEVGEIKNDILFKIDKTLTSILSSLTSLNKLQIKIFDSNRKERENKKRQERESGLEKGKKIITSAVQKMLAPFQDIFDRIWKFIYFTLLGRAFTMLMNWLGDPKNKKKIKVLGRFLKDWWPALLGAVALFMTPFGGFVKGIVSIVTGFSGKILKLIPSLVNIIRNLGGGLAKGAASAGRFAAANPVTSILTIGAIAAGAGAYAASQQNEQRRTEVDPNAVTPKQTREEGKTPGASQLMREQILQRGIGGFSRGAKIEGGYNGVDKNTGIPITGAGRDTQLIAARSGEIVLTPEDRTDIYNKTGYDIADQVKNRKPNFVDSGKIKLFGNTSLMSIGGILGFSKGGMIGDMPIAYSYGQNPHVDTMRRAARLFEKTGFGTEDELFKAFKKLGYIPDIQKMVGGDNFLRISQGHAGYDDALDAIRKSVAEKLKAVNNPQSFTQSSRAAAGLDDLAKKFDMDAKTAPRYAENLPKLNNPKTRVTRVGPNRMLPAAGGSSANAMRAAAKATRNVRPPIPKTSAIVPYTGGGLARTGVTGGLSAPPIQQIRTNMNVPGGRGGRGGIVGGILTSLAEIFKPQIQSFVGDLYDKLGIGEGNLSDAELKKQLEEQTKRVKKLQSGPMGSFMDGGIETDRLKFLQQEANKRKLASLKGGAIKGGYGLKDQSFKDAPKTQIMTDDKGRPFVGYKAMRGGKLVYVRGPKAGEGTSNPLEALGRMINPNAYKAHDEKISRQKHKETLVNSLESLQARGASIETQQKMMKQMGGNLKDVQNDLDYRKKTQEKIKSGQLKPNGKPYTSQEKMRMSIITTRSTKKPPTTPKSYIPSGGGMGGRRGSRSSLGGIKKKKGGGILPITSNFGFGTSSFGADTRYSPFLNTAFQTGESLVDFDYVLTRDSMLNGAGDHLLAFAERLNSTFDSDSKARTSGILPSKNISIGNIPPPPSSSNFESMVLPPIKSSSRKNQGFPGSKTEVDMFSVIPVDEDAMETRGLFAEMYHLA